MKENLAKANIHIMTGCFEEAVEVLEKDDLNTPEALFMLSECYMLSGQFDKAYNSLKML